MILWGPLARRKAGRTYNVLGATHEMSVQHMQARGNEQPAAPAPRIASFDRFRKRTQQHAVALTPVMPIVTASS